MGSNITKMNRMVKAAQDAAGYLVADIMLADRTYLKPGEKAPGGAREQQGERGGRYYESGGETPGGVSGGPDRGVYREPPGTTHPQGGGKPNLDDFAPGVPGKGAAERTPYWGPDDEKPEQRIPRNMGDMTQPDLKAMNRVRIIETDEGIGGMDIDSEADVIVDQAKERGWAELSDPKYVRQLLLIDARRQNRARAKRSRKYPQVYYD